MYMLQPERKGKAIVQALRQFGSYLGNQKSMLLSIHRERRNVCIRYSYISALWLGTDSYKLMHLLLYRKSQQ